MVPRRYEISLLVLKNISLVRYAHSWNIVQHALEEKFRISARPCNILYICISYDRETFAGTELSAILNDKFKTGRTICMKIPLSNDFRQIGLISEILTAS